MKKFAVIIFAATALIFAACGTSTRLKLINSNSENVAINGYDTVAYFGEGAVKGNPQFEFAWNGAKWLFSNAENLEKFKQNPEQFAPQFGGYCSYSVSHNRLADSDPNQWKIVDNKLYLLNNPEAKAKWEAEQKALIEIGQQNWEKFEVNPRTQK